MSSVLPIDSVRQSRLSARLQEISGTDPTVSALVGNLPDLCREASDRMKALPAFHPQFTLHDATHLLRVTELMGKVLGDSLATLNAVEIALLILAAHFHDLGMVPDAEELRALESSDEYRLHRDTWAVEHPNLREIERQIAQRNLADEERARLARLLAELESARLGDYLRLTHGQRSARLVGQLYGSDPRLKVAGASLTDPLARLCESHVLSAADLTPDRLPHDELIGISAVNLRYLALVLRLADILDFDRERTPDGLYRTLHFTSPVSLAEWEKHRGVQGWMIRPDLVRFEMRFDSPVYERTARQFLDWIDVELSAASEIVRSFPQEFARYALDLPLKVDRSRVGPRGEAYVYHDLEFSLSRDEIVKLLMTDKLYGDPSLCVRELLQNSLDALRYRKALLASAGLFWEAGQVDMEHGVDEHGHEFLRCTDNGVGMDEGVITRFLTRAGRSYYRSPEFEQERIRFRAAGVDFDPCSQFGIGFMSCFMLGDRIRIETRRDYGPGRNHGVPWVVEINGLGGMLTLKKGRVDQEVGTAIVISSRPKPAFLDALRDQVKLVKVLHQYALAVEFPIHARCTIPEIQGMLHLPAGLRHVETLLEAAGIQRVLRVEQDLSEVHPELRGVICESFLVDATGTPALGNEEARWSRVERGVYLESGSSRFSIHEGSWKSSSPTCLDGIRVLGSYPRDMHSPAGGPSFLLDIRGRGRPGISPDRNARRMHKSQRDWKRIFRYLDRAEGRLWAQLLQRSPRPAPEILWGLLAVQFGHFTALPSGVIWEHLQVRVVGGEADMEWQLLRDLASLRLETFPRVPPEDRLVTADGRRIARLGPVHTAVLVPFHQDQVNVIVLGLAAAAIREGELRFLIREPERPEEAPLERVIGNASFSIPFFGELAPALGLFSSQPIYNRRHGLIQVIEDSQFEMKWNELQQFAHEIVESSYINVLPELQAKPGRPSKKLKHISYLYLAVDWTRQDPALRPPYRFWGEKEGWVEITDADFRRWAEAEIEER